MPDNKQLLAQYFSSKLSADEKKVLEEQLLELCPEEFLQQRRLDNLLELHFNPVDIQQQSMQSIKETLPAAPIDIRSKAMQSIKKGIEQKPARKRRRRRKTASKSSFGWTLLKRTASLAALCILGFVLFYVFEGSQRLGQVVSSDSGFTLNGAAVNPGEIIRKGDQLSGQARLQLKDGIILSSSADTTWDMWASNSSYLKLKQGQLDLKVASRRGKTALYFNMPQGKVKVIGTEFLLAATKGQSSVSVSEGLVELQQGSEKIAVGAGERGLCDGKNLSKKFLIPGATYSFPFEQQEKPLKFNGTAQFNTGLFGKALHLNGTSWASLQRKQPTQEESFSFWFRANQDSPRRQRLIGQNTGSAHGFNIYVEKTYLILQIKRGLNEIEKCDPTLPTQKWHHVAYSRKASGEYSFYVNGNLIKKNHFPYNYKSKTLNIGSAMEAFFKPLDVSIDELRIYQRYLTAEEVKKLHSEHIFIKNSKKK